MGYDINTITISGNMTRDPELKVVGDTSVCEVGIAYNERFKKGDEWQSRPNYFTVKVWGGMGEQLAQKGSKGMKIVVSGRLTQRSWETDDGGKRSAVEIVANDLVYDSREASSDRESRPAAAAKAPAARSDDFRDIDFGGDDLPF
jgi:single-strand DNA-binding protein